MARLGVVPAALAFMSLSLSAFAQGVAPGGPIGGSTGIGSGLGGVVGGTGPTYPNATTLPPPPAPPPPGGHPIPTISSAPAPALPAARPSLSPQPRDPVGASRPADLPSAPVPLALPARPTADLAFLKGCWRTEVFRYGQHTGTTTWCFNDKGAGRFLYTRVHQPNFFCHGTAEASWGAGRLYLQVREPRCGDTSALDTGRLECSGTAEATRCVMHPGATVRLFRVR